MVSNKLKPAGVKPVWGREGIISGVEEDVTPAILHQSRLTPESESHVVVRHYFVTD